MIYVGIDVGSKELVVSINNKGRVSEAKTYTNTAEGRKSLTKNLKQKKGKVYVGVEATGIYHFDLSVLLSKTDGIEVMVINPRAMSSYSKSRMQRHKTDKIDAKMIREYIERNDFQAWECPSDSALTLRSFSRRLASLTDAKAAAKNQTHAAGATESMPQEVIDSLESQIVFLEKQIEALQAAAVSFIEDNPELKEAFELLISVKGIAEISGVQILGELMVLPDGLSGKQWVAMAGLDPRIYESGTSVKKRSSISKAGSKYLRKALYMPALSAAGNDPYVRGFYLHLIDNRNLKKMQAVSAVMRKLLLAINRMLAEGKPFDNTRFFREPVVIEKKTRQTKKKKQLKAA